MSPTAKDLLAEALNLPTSDRAALAASLIDSLESESDQGSDAVWETEIANRLKQLDNGSVATIPWAEARRRILRSS